MIKTQKKLTNEAQKQRISRNIRADCNGDLLVLSILSGAEIRFNKTKMTSSAKKVYIGDRMKFNETIHNDKSILQNGVLFECAMRKIWNEKRFGTNTELIVNNNLISSLITDDDIQSQCKEKIPDLETDKQTEANFVLWDKSLSNTSNNSVCNQIPLSAGNAENLKMNLNVMNEENSLEKETQTCLRKRKTKNKEASFNNYLSLFLVQHNIDLHCQIVARKLTLRTLHFFLWKKYTLPNGKCVTSEMLQPISSLLRNAISDSHVLSHTSVINKQTLFDIGVTNELLCHCGLDYFIQQNSSQNCYNSFNAFNSLSPMEGCFTNIGNVTCYTSKRNKSIGSNGSSLRNLSVFVPSPSYQYSVISSSSDSFSQ